ncbi:methyltransferase FkbM family [Opitutus terrae PB90-1]|uniref:Methyltransferase FkbM family n=2 Tax=Opitutus terrae TaxID=107709 RepID=B1ZRQ4_OPITP|nr:methyltransferase FkbM family [Opitutus terrae PB90-1]
MAAEVFSAAEFHLFEPLAGHFPDYEAPMKSVLSSHASFSLHAIALGNQTGEQTIHMTPDGVSSSLHPIWGSNISKLKIPCWRLDEYVQAQHIPPPSVLKVDSQGAEALILEGAGALLDTTDLLFLEAWLERGYGPETPLLTELSEALRGRGFILVEIGNPYFSEWHRLASVDAFFLSKRLMQEIREPSNGWRW